MKCQLCGRNGGVFKCIDITGTFKAVTCCHCRFPRQKAFRNDPNVKLVPSVSLGKSPDGKRTDEGPPQMFLLVRQTPEAEPLGGEWELRTVSK